MGGCCVAVFFVSSVLALDGKIRSVGPLLEYQVLYVQAALEVNYHDMYIHA
jgi:hypothetical protein